MRTVDLSHVIEHRRTTSPGPPGPRTSTHLGVEGSPTVAQHPTGLGAVPPTGARSTGAPPAARGPATLPVRARATAP